MHLAEDFDDLSKLICCFQETSQPLKVLHCPTRVLLCLELVDFILQFAQCGRMDVISDSLFLQLFLKIF